MIKILQNKFGCKEFHINDKNHPKLFNSEALSESQSVSDNETKEKICHADEDGISHNGCVSQPSCDECSAFR